MVYRIDGDRAAPFPPGDRGGNPVDAGAQWQVSDYPAAARAVAGRSPVVFSVDAAGPSEQETVARFLTSRGLEGVVLAPVVFWDSLVGVLEFGSATPDGLATATHVAQVAADLLAVALGSGDVIARLQRRNRDLALVVEAGLEDTARLSTDEVLHAVVERLSELTHTPVADIYAVEGDTLRALVSYDGGRFDDGVGRRRPARCGATRAAGAPWRRARSPSPPRLDDPLPGREGRYSLEKWGYQSQLSMPLDRRAGTCSASWNFPTTSRATSARTSTSSAVWARSPRTRWRTPRCSSRSTDATASSTNSSSLARSPAARATSTSSCAPSRSACSGRSTPRTATSTGSCDGCCAASRATTAAGHDDSVLGTTFDLGPLSHARSTAMYNHQVLAITSPDDPQLSETERTIYRDYGFSSEVCLPLVVNDELCTASSTSTTRASATSPSI